MRTLILQLIRLYQILISPLLGASCRFHPTCSTYAAEAVQRYGAATGLKMTAGRICRCHPWHPGGVDPVPDSRSGDPR